MILVFDTETTGMIRRDLRPDDPGQPHIVQLGAILLDSGWREVGCLNVVIKPDGWEVPEAASAIHGITTEIAEKCGVTIRSALAVLGHLSRRAELKVAHNFDFDSKVIRGELMRFDKANQGEWLEPSYCTMRATTPILKIPGNYDDYKWPKLQEVHQFAFGKPFDGAHDAMADVRATAAVYRWLLERKPEMEVA